MHQESASPTVVVVAAAGPPLIIRVLWYLLVGWWLAGLVAACAYALALTVLGLPFALMIFNRIPLVLTLRPATQTTRTSVAGDVTTVHTGGQAQRPMLVRVAYFLLVGWWLTGLWLALAYLLQLTIVGIPLGLLLLNRVGGVLTLYRY